MFSIKVDKNFSGLRLDKFLCKKFDIPFGLAQKLVREKKVKLNGKKADSSYKIQELDQVEIFADLKTRFEKKSKTIKISVEKLKQFLSWVIFEDDNLVAINKPSGLATQGGSGIKISVDDFVKEKKWHLVHRLDKDTSGILLIAKNKESFEVLTKSFKAKTIQKTYLALVSGSLKKTQGVINIPLRKKMLEKHEKVVPDFEEGKEAITKFKLLKKHHDYSLVELQPLTGRTHQLRVHLKELGCPIINDVKYGGKDVLRRNISNRLCLHAYQIELDNFFDKKLFIKADIPDFF